MSAYPCGCDFEAKHYSEDCIRQGFCRNVNAWLPLTLPIRPDPAPIRNILPVDPKARKRFPIASGVLDYFPDALLAVAEVSMIGNDQHNPGKSLRWDRSKSTDEADALLRHFMERGTRDKDGARHSAKVAWRALALLQKEIERDFTEGK